MHAEDIVARVVGPCLHGLHAKRAAACQRAVVAVLLGAALSLSAIALSVRSRSAYRHRIKSVDRLLGNAALQAVRSELYAALAARWLGGVRQVLLVIDWSDLSPDQRWHWLRAIVVVEGRSVTLYGKGKEKGKGDAPLCLFMQRPQHALQSVPTFRNGHQVHVVAHQAIGQDLHAVQCAILCQPLQIRLTVRVAEEDVLTAISALGDVVGNTREHRTG